MVINGVDLLQFEKVALYTQTSITELIEFSVPQRECKSVRVLITVATLASETKDISVEIEQLRTCLPTTRSQLASIQGQGPGHVQ